ncbi:NAD(P)/FAD-dependent oxidoreductase [Cellulosimicrobium sp. Marseille-Q4280]|uniref:NAD(P)/FAD-dependent oxidoreductase n=1 Tax=Cellulosimicrobium sp. Marseille-Q4280 TaxID=2937992 RepID=UPI00203D77C1|nr:NAD(P)/FAD-dependent oxidoreductase [Cellulosimicrobium sp. Marseille-Q4280]
MTTTSLPTHDVAIVGGGPAGLSAAVTLARSLRSVVVIDAGEPRNAPAEGAHNLLGREGVPPRELLAAGRREAASYGAQVRPGRVVAVRREGDGFALDVAPLATLATAGAAGADRTDRTDASGPVDGRAPTTVRARRVLLAAGLVDELPDVPGVRELWGRDVIHCPYCHGYEVRGRRIGVLGTGPNAVHQVLLLRQLSDDVTLFLHTAPEPDDAAWEKLAALGVRVVEGRVARLDVGVPGTRPAGEDGVAGGSLRGVVLEDGTTFAVDAVAVAPRFVARGELFEQLGGELEEHPMGGRFVPVDARGATAVPGVWAAGNTSDLSAMVGASAAAGVMAGAQLNAELVTEDAERAVERRRSPFSAHREAEVAALVAGVRAHGLA